MASMDAGEETAQGIGDDVKRAAIEVAREMRYRQQKEGAALGAPPRDRDGCETTSYVAYPVRDAERAEEAVRRLEEAGVESRRALGDQGMACVVVADHDGSAIRAANRVLGAEGLEVDPDAEPSSGERSDDGREEETPEFDLDDECRSLREAAREMGEEPATREISRDIGERGA